MFHILGFIFFFVLIVLVLGVAVLSKIIRTVLPGMPQDAKRFSTVMKANTLTSRK